MPESIDSSHSQPAASSTGQLTSTLLIVFGTLAIVVAVSFNHQLFPASQLRFIIMGLAVFICIVAIIIIRVIKNKNAALEMLDMTLKDYQAQQNALNQHAIVSISDATGTIVYANDKLCEVSGYSREELIGQTHSIFNSNRHSDAFFEQMWKTIKGGKSWHGEVCNKTKNGNLHWVSSTIFPVLDSNQTPYKYIAIRTDISQQKQIEKRLSKERQFLKGLLDALGDGVYVLNDKGLCTFVNPQAERLLKWSGAELRGKLIHNVIHTVNEHGEKVPADKCPIMLTVTENKVYRSEDEVFTRRNGKQFPVSVVSVPMIQNNKYIGSVTIFKDITEQKIREDQLKLATEEAKKANHAKSEFLSRMSHELRTPMNAILGFAQLLELNDELTEEDQEYIQEILKAGNHLLELINEVLDLSKIEAGRVDLSIEAVACGEVIDECFALLAPLAEGKQITLIQHPEESENTNLLCDRTRLKQILVNLMSNAIKYNHENGEVEISVAPIEDKYWRIMVADNGMGMPKDRQEELFSPFSRLVSDQSEIEGTGIGLVISRQLTEKMHGRLNFDSEEGKGSRFWIDLPDAQATAKKAKKAPVIAHEIVERPNGDGNYKILYIEDNPANLKLVESVVNRLPGHELITSSDPKKGIDIAELEQPDLMLLDIHMPGLTGIDVLKILKQNPEFNDTPFIAISANAMHQDINEALEAGFNEYLTKPLDVELFIATIDKYLGISTPD